jgi:hypothetical protein
MHLLQQRERGIGEWHAVFLPRLHATCREGLLNETIATQQND